MLQLHVHSVTREFNCLDASVSGHARPMVSINEVVTSMVNVDLHVSMVWCGNEDHQLMQSSCSFVRLLKMRVQKFVRTHSLCSDCHDVLILPTQNHVKLWRCQINYE